MTVYKLIRELVKTILECEHARRAQSADDNFERKPRPDPYKRAVALAELV